MSSKDTHLSNKDFLLVTTALEESWMFNSRIIFLGEWCLRKAKQNKWSKIDYLISRFELDSVLNIQAKFLSGGQKKRLVIAMGLISKPDIILMDEPLAALDPQTIQMLQNTIVKLQTDFNLTIITGGASYTKSLSLVLQDKGIFTKAYEYFKDNPCKSVSLFLIMEPMY